MDMGCYSTNEPNGTMGPINHSPNRFSYGVFLSLNLSWIFRKLQQHSMESAHQFSSNPDCNKVADVPFFSFPFVPERWGVDVQWYHDKSSQALPNSRELSVKMTFGFLDGSKNLYKLPRISCEVLVSHGQYWIHWVTKSCTVAYRWLFWDSHSSLGILCSVVIKVTKIFCAKYDSTNSFSARNPCKVGPLTDLAVSVFRQMNLNTVKTRYHPSQWLWRGFMGLTRVWLMCWIVAP